MKLPVHLLLIVPFLVACPGDPPSLSSEELRASRLEITPAGPLLRSGDLQEFRAEVITPTGQRRDVSDTAQWEPSKEGTLVRDDRADRWRAIERGEWTLSATWNGLVASTKVQVTSRTLVRHECVRLRFGDAQVDIFGVLALEDGRRLISLGEQNLRFSWAAPRHCAGAIAAWTSRDDGTSPLLRRSWKSGAGKGEQELPTPRFAEVRVEMPLEKPCQRSPAEEPVACAD